MPYPHILIKIMKILIHNFATININIRLGILLYILTDIFRDMSMHKQWKKHKWNIFTSINATGWSALEIRCSKFRRQKLKKTWFTTSSLGRWVPIWGKYVCKGTDIVVKELRITWVVLVIGFFVWFIHYQLQPRFYPLFFPTSSLSYLPTYLPVSNCQPVSTYL